MRDVYFNTQEFYRGIIQNKDFLNVVERSFCCYGRCTTPSSCPLNTDNIHITIYVPHVTHRTKNEYYVYSSWFRQPRELFNRVEYMTEKLKPYAKNINYNLQVTQHSDLKQFCCNTHPYFEFDFHFKNVQRHQMFFILDMYRRTFNAWYDKIWACIPRLEEEFNNLDFVNLWIFSDLVNTWQARDASFYNIYSYAVNNLFSPKTLDAVNEEFETSSTNGIFISKLHYKSKYDVKKQFVDKRYYNGNIEPTDSFKDLSFDDKLYKAIFDTILNFKRFNEKTTGYELF